MPTTDAAIDTTTTDAPATTAPILPAIRARFIRTANEGLTLEIDATALHAYLDLLGVPHDGARYADAPGGNGYNAPADIDTYSHRINPVALTRVGILRIRLSSHYRGPIPKVQLDALARSIEAAALAVVEHYRPVTLRVEVALKKA